MHKILFFAVKFVDFLDALHGRHLPWRDLEDHAFPVVAARAWNAAPYETTLRQRQPTHHSVLR